MRIPKQWRTRCFGIAGTIVLLQACAARTSDEAQTWRPAFTSDSVLTFRLPARYQARNPYGCWDSYENEAERSGFCLYRSSVDEVSTFVRSWSVPCEGPESTAGDKACYDRLQVDTVRAAGRTLVVRRALLSGTISHYDQYPAVLVIVPIDTTGVVILDGTMRTQALADELVAIASSVQERARD